MISDIIPNIKQAAICGLFCPACSVFRATQENNIEKLMAIAKGLNQSLENTYCDGCRTDRKTEWCSNCTFIKCAEEKNVGFCGDCDEYPCESLKDFQSKMPHRAELWADQARIKEIGWEKWYLEKVEYYSCKSCDSMNSSYDLACRNCGAQPGNEFVKNNIDAIKAHFAKLSIK